MLSWQLALSCAVAGIVYGGTLALLGLIPVSGAVAHGIALFVALLALFLVGGALGVA